MIAVDSAKFQVIPNPLNRFLLNKESGLEPNADGSLTLAFAPRKPTGLPEPNWLPTPEGQSYNLTYRFYGPSQDIVSGQCFRRRSLNKSDVRYWHLADIDADAEHVCFWG